MIKLNGIEITPTIFPDGCSQVWKLAEELINSDTYHIEWYFKNENEVIYLHQLRTLLYSVGTNKKCTLYIDYLPYARQDKKVTNTSCFGLYAFIRILCLYPYEKIEILDPHSDMIFLMGKKIQPIYLTDKVKEIFKETKSDVVCYPDKGALSKYTKIYKDLPYIHASKERNQLTGEITKHELIGDVKDKNILIVDDILDGGATFIHLAKLLKDNGAKEINIFVTHGLYTKGPLPLWEAGIRNLYDKNGLYEVE